MALSRGKSSYSLFTTYTHTLVILYETHRNPNFSQYIIEAFLLQGNLHIFLY